MTGKLVQYCQSSAIMCSTRGILGIHNKRCSRTHYMFYNISVIDKLTWEVFSEHKWYSTTVGNLSWLAQMLFIYMAFIFTLVPGRQQNQVGLVLGCFI